MGALELENDFAAFAVGCRRAAVQGHDSGPLGLDDRRTSTYDNYLYIRAVNIPLALDHVFAPLEIGSQHVSHYDDYQHICTSHQALAHLIF